MQTISEVTVNLALSYPKLINALQRAFTENIIVPPRLHFDIENPSASRETTLLMMPAWQAGDVAGIKLVTVAPDNHQHQLPTIQGTYLLVDVKTGTLKASMDAPSLTAKRTAAASALASRFLSRDDSKTLLVVGTGTLSSQLIEAHSSVRPIKTVYVWGRSLAKAELVCQQVQHLGLECIAVSNLKEHVNKADIISCATLSTEPLIFGEWLQKGQHLDMVGAYRPDMREMAQEEFKESKKAVAKLAEELQILLLPRDPNDDNNCFVEIRAGAGGDEASKVWLLRPQSQDPNDWNYDSAVIFDINDYYGPNAAQSFSAPLPATGVSISTIGAGSWRYDRDWAWGSWAEIYIPVFEGRDLHRITFRPRNASQKVVCPADGQLACPVP